VGEPALLDAGKLTSDPELAARFAESAHRILADLVTGGAALGWVEPPARDEVAEFLARRYGRLRDFVAVGERRYDKLFYMLDLRRPG
jgi:hypothetical protein